MKTKMISSKICSDRLSPKRGYFLSLVTNSFVALLLGLLFASFTTVPAYMSLQTAMQLLELSSAAHLQSLVTEPHPTVYLTKGEIRASEELAPAVAICDAASVNMLYANAPSFSQVELVKIIASSIDDLPASIDLIKLEELTNLKYLLVEFAYDACDGSTNDCQTSILEGIIQGTSTQITVIYSQLIPE
ncbi:MAG TPA: hypothetical protein VFC92_14035 [Bacteroidales bacterium]|nr:hypothetical protein [Bacteroidales bacterium]